MQKRERPAGESILGGLSKAKSLDKFVFSNGEVQLTDGFYSSSQSDITQPKRPDSMTIQQDQSSSSSIQPTVVSLLNPLGDDDNE